MGLLDQGANMAPAAAPAPAPAAPSLAGFAQSAAAAGAPPPGAQEAGAVPAGAPAAAPQQATEQLPAGAPEANSGGAALSKADMDIGEEAASPEEQQSYEQAMQALSTILYENEAVSNSVVDQIDQQDLIGSTTKTSMLFIKQLDEKIDMDEGIVAELTQESVSRIMELAEARHGVQYSERDEEIILGATWEGITQMFGGDQESMNELINSVGTEKLPQLKQHYEAALNG